MRSICKRGLHYFTGLLKCITLSDILMHDNSSDLLHIRIQNEHLPIWLGVASQWWSCRHASPWS